MEKDRRNAIIAGAVALGVALSIATVSVACAAATTTRKKLEVVEIQDVEEPEVPETQEPEVEEPEVTDPEEPETPEEPKTDDPEVDDPEVEEPETPEEPEVPEEPQEPQTPTIDPTVVYNFNEIKELLMTYEELNYSYCTVKVRVAGTALGVPGYCFFQDLSDKAINYGSEITQARMADLLAREDVGNNNVWLTRGDVITLSGVVAYEHVTYLGVNLVTIK